MKFLTTLATALITMAALTIDHSVYANDNSFDMLRSQHNGSETKQHVFHAGAVRTFDSVNAVAGAAPPNESMTSNDETVHTKTFDLPPTSAHSTSEASRTDLPHIRIHPQQVVVPLSQTETRKVENIPAVSVALICLGIVGAVLLTYSIVLLAVQRREKKSQNRVEFLPTPPASDVFPSPRNVLNDSNVSCDSRIMRMSDFKNRESETESRESTCGSSGQTTPILQDPRKVLYTSMATPASKGGFIV